MRGLRMLSRKWWFWVAVIIAIPMIWWVWGYVTWQLDRQDMVAENRAAYLGWMEMEAEQVDLEARYKADTYGGSTPEETLRLFVEALEKKDFELAAKYFVPENQAKALEENRLGESGGANKFILDAYKLGTVSFVRFSNGKSYEAKILHPEETVPMIVEFLLNPYSEKWKIVEL